MNIGDYKFNVGDEVVTIDGERGKITYICDCEQCKARGFCEPVWENEYDGEDEYIEEGEARRGFLNYYKIGDYYFSDFNRDWVQRNIDRFEARLTRLRTQLRVIDEIESNKED